MAAQADSVAARPGGPVSEKAQKSFQAGQEWEHRHLYAAAIDSYRKASEQDGGACQQCLQRMYALANKIGDHKNAEEAARGMLASAQTPAEKAVAHYYLAVALQRHGVDAKKEKCFSDSCDELRAALDASPKFASAHYVLGVSLAHLHQDDAARAEFAAYVNEGHDAELKGRAERYLKNVELARARMVPPFTLTTLDGRQVSMDELAGKVVLIDFWATWCGPCREALPRIKSIANKFKEEPLVVLSISLDNDDQKWRDFVAQNGMDWLQARDGRFTGPMATKFGVTAIPSTFTIDADGVLEDQHVGDANIEGKLKKLVARAREVNDKQSAGARLQERPAEN